MDISESQVYVHPEAFMVMQYRCNRGHSEKIWNSRDGVTPFCLPCLQCDEDLQHVNWNGDVRKLTHKMKPGDRFFRDGTAEEARAIVRQRIEQSRGTEYALSAEEEAAMIQDAPNWSEFQQGWPYIETVKDAATLD